MAKGKNGGSAPVVVDADGDVKFEPDPEPGGSWPAVAETAVPVLAGGAVAQRVGGAYATAMSVQVPRNLEQVTRRLLQEARLAGESFYYGWAVAGRGGKSEQIEGPSVDLAVAAARCWGNCAVEPGPLEEFLGGGLVGFDDVSEERLKRRTAAESTSKRDRQGCQLRKFLPLGQVAGFLDGADENRRRLQLRHMALVPDRHQVAGPKCQMPNPAGPVESRHDPAGILSMHQRLAQILDLKGFQRPPERRIRQRPHVAVAIVVRRAQFFESAKDLGTMIKKRDFLKLRVNR